MNPMGTSGHGSQLGQGGWSATYLHTGISGDAHHIHFSWSLHFKNLLSVIYVHEGIS